MAASMPCGEARMIAPKPLPPPIRIDSRNIKKGPSLHPTHPAARPQRKPMTIAIGFAYDSGMLFCADTMITGAIRQNQSKIVHHVSDDGNCSITFAMSAVDLNFPVSAVSKCWEAVRKMDFAVRSLDEVHHLVELSLADFYATHIYEHPDRAPNSIYMQFLVGIWVRGQYGVYLSNETVLNPVTRYQCIGAAAYLTKYLMGEYFKANPGANSLQDAVLIVRHAVQAAINYDRDCGGIPEMLIVRANGTIDRECREVWYPSEKFISGLSQLTWKTLHALANLDNDGQWGDAADKIINDLSPQALELDMSKWDF